MSEDSFMQYDEAEAVKFIRNYMPEDIRDRYDDDEILNIIDMIWDFYEEQGLLQIPEQDNSNDSMPADYTPILAYVKKMLSKDKLAVVDTDDVHYIVEGELEYEKSIGLEDEV